MHTLNSSMEFSSPFKPFSLILIFSLLSFNIVESRDPFACDPRNGLTRSLAFCNTTLPVNVRVQDLIGRLTLAEKVRLIVDNAIAVPRLGIQGYEWWSEALHGVSNLGPGTKFGGAFPGATSFPQVITTAASFNHSLWEEIGRVRIFHTHRSFLPSEHPNFTTIGITDHLYLMHSLSLI